MSSWYEKLSHKVEDNAFKLSVWSAIAVLVGGLVTLPPLFLQGTVQKIDSVKPYNALELAGRDVYQEEGCFYCHSQMVRPFKWETDRWDPTRQYGDTPYSKAGESVYDHPFLWGSKRIGPDLAHEAALRGSAAWQVSHLKNPRETSPGSIMPAYPHLFETDNMLDTEVIKARMSALRILGVPYTDQDIQNADSLAKNKTKGDALVSYLLKLGKDTMQ
ncbi:MAG: cbb3-type cytochrome c oxidase subunit II [Spirochaetia bacterium]|nr:cbb3-type cytochrome c oxidase subunit II [Spirochaetia bacterium]